MKNKPYYLLGLLIILLGSACSPSLSPFNQRLVDQNRWSESDLKEIQFYLSKDITLYRDYTSGGSRIESGEIKIVKGRKVEKIVIKKGTPGVALFQPKGKLAVSFEDNQDDRFLIFGPNPKRGNNYVLLATDWKNRQGKVKYENQVFYTNAESALATLMVDLDRSNKVSVKSRSAKGRKIE